MFLVNWITVLDSIPDLELISHLPAFLKGLMMFLSDQNDDVRTATNKALNHFLQEIHKVSEVKKTLKERKSSRGEDSETASGNLDGEEGLLSAKAKGKQPEHLPEDFEATDDWLPGQDTHIDFRLILAILIAFVGDPGISLIGFSDKDELIQLTALRWVNEFFSICPEDILAFTPSLLEQVLPILAHPTTSLAQVANSVNENLLNIVLGIPQSPVPAPPAPARSAAATPRIGSISGASIGSAEDKDVPGTSKETPSRDTSDDPFDYPTTVNSLTLQFLNEHEETRVAAFDWLLMLHKKAPNKVCPLKILLMTDFYE